MNEGAGDVFAQNLLLLVVGAILGGLIQAIVAWYNAFRESQGIAHAIEAEIASLIGLTILHQYKDELRVIIQRLENPDHQPTVADIYAIQIGHDYFSVFHALCGKIGSLRQLSGKVVEVYALGKSFLEDLKQLTELQEKMLHAPDTHLNREGLLELTKRAETQLNLAIEKASELLKELRAFSMKSWIFGSRSL